MIKTTAVVAAHLILITTAVLIIGLLLQSEPGRGFLATVVIGIVWLLIAWALVTVTTHWNIKP